MAGEEKEEILEAFREWWAEHRVGTVEVHTNLDKSFSSPIAFLENQYEGRRISAGEALELLDQVYQKFMEAIRRGRARDLYSIYDHYVSKKISWDYKATPEYFEVSAHGLRLVRRPWKELIQQFRFVIVPDKHEGRLLFLWSPSKGEGTKIGEYVVVPSTRDFPTIEDDQTYMCRECLRLWEEQGRPLLRLVQTSLTRTWANSFGKQWTVREHVVHLATEKLFTILIEGKGDLFPVVFVDKDSGIQVPFVDHHILPQAICGEHFLERHLLGYSIRKASKLENAINFLISRHRIEFFKMAARTIQEHHAQAVPWTEEPLRSPDAYLRSPALNITNILTTILNVQESGKRAYLLNHTYYRSVPMTKAIAKALMGLADALRLVDAMVE